MIETSPPVGPVPEEDLFDLQVAITNHWKVSDSVASPRVGWDSWWMPYRTEILWALDKAHSRDLYEIGCGSGPNLRLIRDKTHGLKLGGCDIRPENVAWCKDRGFDVQELALPSRINEWDTVYSCYTLAYLETDLVLHQLQNINSRVLILLEPGSEGGLFVTGKNMIPRWYHPWGELLEKSSWKVMASKSVEPTEDHLQEIVVAVRS